MHLNPRHAKARGLYKTFKKKLRLRIQIIVFYGTDEAMGRSLVWISQYLFFFLFLVDHLSTRVIFLPSHAFVPPFFWSTKRNNTQPFTAQLYFFGHMIEDLILYAANKLIKKKKFGQQRNKNLTFFNDAL